jgi:predicted CXXCH cytochrome family protein
MDERMRPLPGPFIRVGRFLIMFTLCGAIAAVVLMLATARGLILKGPSIASADEPTPAPAHLSSATSFDNRCLECHSDPNLSMTFPNGDVLSLYLNGDEFHESVHGTRLACADCHQRNVAVPHQVPKVQSARQLALVEYEVCKRCHFENYTRTLDSMHFDAMAEGKEEAPICTDCHTAHNVIRLTESRVKIATTCSTCHDDIAEEYQESVHGTALNEEDNPDVPVCITCHGVHNIASATTASFRQQSVQLCAKCHADKELMGEYDISADVFKTYLDDFHGKTVGFVQGEAAEVWPDVAVCTDCHGVHDITKVDDPDSPVIKQNLVETCRQCHEDATTNFSSAWLSHYEPSLDKAPLVYLVKQYYKFLIPAMILGLALNIALDLWRLARNR